MDSLVVNYVNKLSCRRGTTLHAMSVGLFNCCKIPFGKASMGQWLEGHSRSSVLLLSLPIRVCWDSISVLQHFGDVATFTVHVIVCDLEKSFTFDNR